MTVSDSAVRVWGLIPAAGLGRRMGGPKQTLRYRGSTMVSTVTRTLLEADLAGVIVVTRTELIVASDLPDDPRVTTVVNDDADSEMIDSVRIGLAALARLGASAATGVPVETDGVLVVPADMPAITAATCRTCMVAFTVEPTRIVIATYNDHRGHPIIFPLALRGTIDRLEGGLRSLPGQYPARVCLVEVNDPGVLRDADTMDDFHRL